MDPQAPQAEASDTGAGVPSPAASASRPLLELSPSFGRLASVQRTLAWALDHRRAAARARSLGAACARLVEQAVAIGGFDESQASDVVALVPQLRELDSLRGRARSLAAKDVVQSLGRVVPEDMLSVGIPEPAAPPKKAKAPAAAPAPVAQDTADAAESTPAPPRAARSSSRGRRSSRKPVVAPAEPVVDAASEPDRNTGDDPSSRRRRRRRGRRRPEDDAAVESTRAEAPAPAPAPARESRAVERLPLDHPDGAGRELNALDKVLGETGALRMDELEALDAAGIQTIADLLLTVPTAHQRPPKGRSSEAGATEDALWRGKVVNRCIRFAPESRRWELTLRTRRDDLLLLRWMGNPPRGWDDCAPGQELGFVGALVETDQGGVVYEAEPVGVDGRGSGLLPCYGIDEIPDDRMRALVVAALRSVENRLMDVLPDGLLSEHRLLPIEDALRDAHFPANPSGRGRIRLAFEELLLLQLGVAWRAGRGRVERGQAHKALHELVGQLAHQHQIELDDIQELAFSEIRRDLRATAPMARLLQGDVGTGKSLVALMSALLVAANGSQVAMIAPDALAAERRYLHVEPILRSIGVNVLYVGNGPNRAQADAIRRGEALLVYGTRTLLAENLEWKRLGLVVVEERGPYGTVTPGSLRSRGVRPDLLVITRAPIPSSLAFTVFGDFDVSLLTGRGSLRVASEAFPPDRRTEAYARAQQAIEGGRQVFVVFPVRDGRDLLTTEDAIRMAKLLQADLLPGARIGVYCSDMSREERGRVYDDFQHRRVDVLVCTTFIEDAPPVANATDIVVEYADLHDVVRLHRLRAHVGQARLPGFCAYVLSAEPTEAGKDRVNLAQGELDGFRLAEVDLQDRGARALLGDRAAEVPTLRWADPTLHRSLLLRARAEAFGVVQADPDLRDHPLLAEAVTVRWGEWLGLNVGTPSDGSTSRRTRGERRRRRRRRRR